MSTFYDWSQTAASNNTADSSINWREGQAPSTVNNSARAMMAALAKYRDDVAGSLNTGGASTAYTVSTNQGYGSLADGITITVRPHTTSGAAPTLNVDSLGAKAIRTATGVALPTGAFVSGSMHKLTYDLADDCWYAQGVYVSTNLIAPATTAMMFAQTAAPTGWTKSTTHNDKALRVVSGTASSGGSVAFTTAFASQSVTGTTDGTALSAAQIPAHQHFLFANTGNHTNGSNGSVSNTQYAVASAGFGNSNSYTMDSPSDGTTANVGLTSSIGSGSTHNHTFTGNAINLAVAYTDCIIALKD